MIVSAIDVGSARNFGWWRVEVGAAGRGGRRLEDLVVRLGKDLQSGQQVALGFEAPLFVPLPEGASSLGKARRGDGNRSWSAAAGAVVMSYATQQVAWTLRAIAQHSHPAQVVLGFDPMSFSNRETNLLVWEAFVSGPAKNRAANDPHSDDARAAVGEFLRRWEDGHLTSDVEEPAVFNLAGAAALRAGLSSDLALLSQEAVVVRVGMM